MTVYKKSTETLNVSIKDQIEPRVYPVEMGDRLPLAPPTLVKFPLISPVLVLGLWYFIGLAFLCFFAFPFTLR
jgi:hypothetical protein